MYERPFTKACSRAEPALDKASKPYDCNKGSMVKETIMSIPPPISKAQDQ